MSRLDEKALRREAFSEGHAVTLADGQDWTFPRPAMRLFPVVDPESGSLSVGADRSFGADFDKLLNVFMGGDEVDDFEQVRLQFVAAVSLLGRNYDLKAGDYPSLLVIDPSDPENPATWNRITRILLGMPPEVEEDPKPSADGSDGP